MRERREEGWKGERLFVDLFALVFVRETERCFRGTARTRKTRTYLQEEERDFPLGAELDKVCTLDSRFGEENPVVGDDANRHTM